MVLCVPAVTKQEGDRIYIFFTLILSTLASSFSCSTSRRMLDKLELEVMLVKIVLGEKNPLKADKLQQ